jgi:hypothetical protein
MKKICPHKVGVVKIVKYSASYTWQPMGSSFVTYEQTVIPWLPNTAYLHHWDEWRIHYQNSQNYHSALNKGWRFYFIRLLNLQWWVYALQFTNKFSNNPQKLWAPLLHSTCENSQTSSLLTSIPRRDVSILSLHPDSFHVDLMFCECFELHWSFLSSSPNVSLVFWTMLIFSIFSPTLL